MINNWDIQQLNETVIANHSLIQLLNIIIIDLFIIHFLTIPITIIIHT